MRMKRAKRTRNPEEGRALISFDHKLLCIRNILHQIADSPTDDDIGHWPPPWYEKALYIRIIVYHNQWIHGFIQKMSRAILSKNLSVPRFHVCVFLFLDLLNLVPDWP